MGEGERVGPTARDALAGCVSSSSLLTVLFDVKSGDGKGGRVNAPLPHIHSVSDVASAHLHPPPSSPRS